MKVLFVDLLNLFYDQHGIYALSAILKKNGISTAYIGARDFKTAKNKILQARPDVLLYSAFSANIRKYREFDLFIKKDMPEIHSIIGGPGPTFDWKFIEDSTINALCAGEGETALVEYLKNGFKSVKNIFNKGDVFPQDYFPFVDLDLMPFPDRSVVYKHDSLLRDTPSKQFFSGRGCPYDCSYCFNHSFRKQFRACGNTIRRKSVDYMLEEVAWVKKEYGLANAVFNDDTFIIDKKWFMEFCDKYPRKIGISYTCNILANLLDDDMAKALKESNCITVNWSIESGNAVLRNEVLNRNMTNEQIINAAELLNKYKIMHRIGNVIALPGETIDQIYETVELNIKARPYMGLANIFVPFPGLRLTDYAIKNKYCDETSYENLPKDYFTTSVMKIDAKQKIIIYKIMCLFPLFTAFPRLFYNKHLRDMALKLPGRLVRVIYELVYTFKMSRLYTSKTPVSHKIRMAIRYLRNI